MGQKGVSAVGSLFSDRLLVSVDCYETLLRRIDRLGTGIGAYAAGWIIKAFGSYDFS